MNIKQKIILAIFVPAIIFLAALTIAYYLNVEDGGYSITHNPFDWGKTWYVWSFSLIGVILFEYELFEDKKVISKKRIKK
ncbi:hypothetical protein CVT91_09905 [Candidatus Atribacteria bacterium HGW-Atribacteria-1]|nr:MAG: hypothetical protein CVT91_09905 [Candidatus Atribacteria bacterium HGW-Atribacteria-1]